MTAHSRWLISSIPFVPCSDRCPLNPLSPSPPSRLAFAGPVPFLLSSPYCYHILITIGINAMSLVRAVRQQSEKFNLVLDLLRQLLQPLRLALSRYLAFIYMMNFLHPRSR